MYVSIHVYYINSWWILHFSNSETSWFSGSKCVPFKCSTRVWDLPFQQGFPIHKEAVFSPVKTQWNGVVSKNPWVWVSHKHRQEHQTKMAFPVALRLSWLRVAWAWSSASWHLDIKKVIMAVSARRQNAGQFPWLLFLESGTLQTSSNQDFLTKFVVKSRAPIDTAKWKIWVAAGW